MYRIDITDERTLSYTDTLGIFLRYLAKCRVLSRKKIHYIASRFYKLKTAYIYALFYHLGDLGTGDSERAYISMLISWSLGNWRLQEPIHTLCIKVHILEIWRLETRREYTRKHAYT